jgi:hypothetical protein
MVVHHAFRRNELVIQSRVHLAWNGLDAVAQLVRFRAAVELTGRRRVTRAFPAGAGIQPTGRSPASGSSSPVEFSRVLTKKPRFCSTLREWQKFPALSE